MKNQVQFKHFGTMIDCSRNAVMNVKTLKKWIDLTADLGYNTLCLYMEDTYEVADEPYFGYLRGRYSKEELKEIDEYAKKRGMEVIPCIQTLAHLATIFRHGEYGELHDIDDCLLVENADADASAFFFSGCSPEAFKNSNKTNSSLLKSESLKNSSFTE